MVSLKEIIYLVLNEAKSAFKAYMHDTEDALKKRLKKLLIYSIVTSVLVALITSFLGSASLFILIGSLKYLELTMPAWEAWYIDGITSAIIGVVLIIVVFLIIRKQLKSN